MLLGLALAACFGQGQTAVWSASTAATDPTFTTYYTTIHGLQEGDAGSELDVTMNQLWGQIGQTFATPRNWNGNNGFSLAVQNQENFPISLGFRVETASGAPMISIFDIPAGQRVKFFVDNSGFSPQATGMDRPLPIFNGFYRHTMVLSPQTLSQVTKWQIYYRNETPARIRISSISGHQINLSYSGAIDRFGQLSYQDWVGKAHDDQDLMNERDREAVELATNPGGANVMGSTTLGSVTATGKWRTIKGRNGKWYIATPAGKLFWSVGLTSVNKSNPTIVEGREPMFQSLPGAGDPEEQFYDQTVRSGQTLRTFDFTTANLARKYGAQWETAWATRAAQRVKAWGLNTLGTGSDLGIMEQHSIPGAVSITTTEFPIRLNVAWSFWGSLPDPHHSAFTPWLVNRYRAKLQYYCRNNKLMGVYVDGENAWSGLGTSAQSKFQIPLAALRSPKTQPSKQVFLAQLRTKYPTIQALNTAWRTQYPSWSYMYDNDIQLSANYTDPQIADFTKFLSTFAAKYFHGVRLALNEINSNCLFLGSKDSMAWTPAEVHEQAAKYVDIISVTYYGKVSDINWNYLNSLKKPALIAEFSFSSNDRGPSASTNWMGELQFEAERRATEARAYLDRALASPNVVGAHWYSYRDNVLSGRASDTQNYAVGFVDITDRPYEEIVNVFRSFTSNMYSQRGFW